nr:restriction endonuclease subunit S [Pseudomonas luteola]
MEYKPYKLRELLTETKDGEWGKDEPFEDSIEMAVIRGTDFEKVKNNSLLGVPIRHISGKAARRKLLQPLDILLETAGGSKGKPTGKTTLLKRPLFEKTNLSITCASFARYLRINSEIADPEYIYWCLQALYVSGIIEDYQVQHTGIARFQFTRFADSYDFSLPPLWYQRKIVQILGCLDERLILLRETNATLEAIAQALFKSWFVDFDPVHAKAEGRQPEGMDAATSALFPDSFEESELGLVPKGWKTGVLSSICTITSGKRPPDRSDTYTEVCSTPLYGGAGLMGYTSDSLYNEILIVTGRVGTLGKVHIAYPPFWASDNVLVLSPILPINFLFAFYWIKSVDVQALNRGSTQPLLTQRDLGAQQSIIPSQQSLQKFGEIAGVLHKQIRSNELQAQTLTQLRDTLLPRLISGQLRLPEAESLLENVL